MTIKMREDGNKLTVEVSGRLDTVTAPELAVALAGKEPEQLIIDLSQLEYISSAGLRILFSAQKAANDRNGTLIVKNPNPVVRGIFKITGFDQRINIQ